MQLRILSGGAAQSVVTALADQFRAETGYGLDCSFSAVGEMKAKLLAGVPADVVILTRALIVELAASGHVLPASPADLGRVRTGVAVRSGDPFPDIASARALRSTLLDAEGIFFPDPQKSDRRHSFCARAGYPGHQERSRAALEDLSQRGHGHARTGRG